MDTEEAKKLLAQAKHSDEPVVLTQTVLDDLSIDDIPENILIEVGISDEHIVRLQWEGQLYRQKDAIVIEADCTNTRKYWHLPLNLRHYLDLVRRAIELRQREHGDVELDHYDDDGAYIQMSYLIYTGEKNLGKAHQKAKALRQQLEEAADDAADQVGKKVAEIASQVSGWGSQKLDVVLKAVEKASSADERGRSLEELVSRLFETVPGFSVSNRIRTAKDQVAEASTIRSLNRLVSRRRLVTWVTRNASP